MIAAIVPAAGLSRRMGRPKPLLEIDGMSLIVRVVRALRDGGADRVIVVAPPAGRMESAAIVREAGAAGGEVVVLASETADMRASIEAALDRIEEGGDVEAILLAPADLPGIAPALVERVIRAGRGSPGSIARPRAGAKRGHPVYLPRGVVDGIRSLPAGLGVNALVDDPARRVVEVEVEGSESLADVDTPEDYRRWIDAAGPPPGRRPPPSPNSFG